MVKLLNHEHIPWLSHLHCLLCYLVEAISTSESETIQYNAVCNFLTFQFMSMKFLLMCYKVNIQLKLQIDKVTVEGMRKATVILEFV